MKMDQSKLQEKENHKHTTKLIKANPVTEIPNYLKIEREGGGNEN